MTEAVNRIIKFTFEELDGIAVEAEHATWNEPSKKVLQRIGMKHVGHNPCGYKKRGECVPEEEYRLEKSDWVNLQN